MGAMRAKRASGGVFAAASHHTHPPLSSYGDQEARSTGAPAVAGAGAESMMRERRGRREGEGLRRLSSTGVFSHLSPPAHN